MTNRNRLRWSLIAVGLLLPLLSLIPLGSFWLWQNGWLLYWALAAAVTTLLAYAGLRWLLGPVINIRPDVETTGQSGDPGWTPSEQAAWARVQAIAAAAQPEALKSRDAAVALGLETIDAVARTMKPERREPLLQFTAPEALALVERVAHRMNSFVRDNVPLADKLTVAQAVTLYRWRGAIDTAEQAYGIWRAIRVLNPATAIAAEVRERLSKEIMSWGRDHIARRLVTAYVDEVGRAAIDLYSGRLRLEQGTAEAHVSRASARDQNAITGATVEPLRILVAGQISAGKSSLVNALASEAKAAIDVLPATASFTPYELRREGLPAALLIDSPGIKPDASDFKPLSAAAADSDLILWVSAAPRADREADRRALAAVRSHFAARPDRRPPPIVLVVSQIDRLRPFQEWRPPYDLDDKRSPKAHSIRGAVDAAAADLGFDAADLVPVCLADPPGLYNIDALWARIGEGLPDAERARLVRLLRDAAGSWDWRQIWSQAVNGGRVIVRAATSR